MIRNGEFSKVAKWATENRGEVYDISRKYSGSFVQKLADAFVSADVVNTNKILNMWQEEFVELYNLNKAWKEHEQKRMEEQDGKTT